MRSPRKSQGEGDETPSAALQPCRPVEWDFIVFAASEQLVDAFAPLYVGWKHHRPNTCVAFCENTRRETS